MTKREELDLFITKSEDFIDSKYILADIKIAGLLKSIALSETLLALFKNCLQNYDFTKAKKAYLIKSNFSDTRGEFILPKSSKELLAFVFSILLEIDSKKIFLNEFLDKYFYVDGSSYSSYNLFINSMIKPFSDTVKSLMENVLDGTLEDPIDAFSKEEQKRQKDAEEKRIQLQKEKEISKKKYGESIKALKEILIIDKKKVKEKNVSYEEKERLTLIIDMLANVIESSDRDAIIYAYSAYYYAVKSHKFLFFKRLTQTKKYILDIINEI